MPKDTVVIKYDYIWKEAIVEFFEDFLLFFLPALHADVDWSKEPVFLEQELHTITKQKDPHKKIADKLVKVKLKNGSEKWVFIHIEVQGRTNQHFPKRMYTYNVLAEYNYEQSITALAIFTHEETPAIYDRYEMEYYGTYFLYKYNTYRVKDQTEEVLLQSNNPFALVVLANWYVLKTKGNFDQRLLFKKNMHELAKKWNYSSSKIRRLLIFVEHLIGLPKKQEILYQEHLKEITNKSITMLKVSKKQKDFADEVYELCWGQNPKELREENKKTHREIEKERAKRKAIELEKEQERHEKEQERHEKEQERINTVLNLYHKLQLSPEQIAQVLGIDANIIDQIIANNA